MYQMRSSNLVQFKLRRKDMHPRPSLPIYPTHHPLTKGIIDGTSASTRMISNAILRTVINIYTGTPPFSNPSDYIGHIRVFVFFQPIYISAIGHCRICSHVRTLMTTKDVGPMPNRYFVSPRRADVLSCYQCWRKQRTV